MSEQAPLWLHQQQAIARAKSVSNFALFFDCGTGKTRTTIEILRGKFNSAKRILRTLILAPPVILCNWKDEWLKFSKISPEQVVLLRGAGKRRLKLFEENADKPRVFVTNYESLLMEDLYTSIKKWSPEALVFDESHKLKDFKAKRSKLADELSNGDGLPRLRYLLTGSPVLNSPMDLYQQFLILDGGATFGANFFAFRGRYFRDRNAGMPKDRYFPDWHLMPGALDEISKQIGKSSMRVLKSECLDLPPLVREVRRVALTPDQRRLYKEMKDDFVTFLNGQAVTASMAMTKALRLMQIASGYVKTTEGEEIELTDTPKMAALEELLQEITPTAKVLVWGVWKKNYAQIRRVCEQLNIGLAECHGDISDVAKQANIRRFKEDPNCRVFLAHPGSGGIGINLVNAPYSIFYSRNFSLEHSLQAESRNHRGGAEIHEKITRIDLIAEDTIEEIVSERLANKQEISDSVLRDLSRELMNQEN